MPLNFAGGLDTKTDEKQVPFGKFLRLINTVFQKTGLMQKRNGFARLADLPDDTYSYTTTFNGNLTAIGSNMAAYSNGSKSWTSKGSLQPVELDTLPLFRSNTNQSQADSCVSPNGLICTAFTDNVAGSAVYKYVIADATTGQNVLPITTIANGSGSPRVFLLGNYFMIVFTATIAANPHLQFIAVNIYSLSSNAAVDISTTYTPATTVNFDCVVANSNLYVAWNGSDGGGAIRVTKINIQLAVFSPVVFASRVATIMSVTTDATSSTPVVYVSFYNSGTSTGYTLAVNQNLGTVFNPVQIIASGTVLNITSSAQNNSCTVFYEVSNSYTYDTNIKTNYIKKIAVAVAGTAGSASTVIRSVGLASKSFIIDSVVYFLSAYSSTNQPTYFLSNSSGNVVSKLASSNGGGYLVLGLPNVSVTDTTAQVPYLFKDLVQAVNKTQGEGTPSGIYSQTGVNLASFLIGTSKVLSSEIASDLHLSGGFLWMYDGYAPVEHGFWLYPENVEIVGSATSGSMTAQQYYYQAIYQWSDNQGNIHQSAASIPVSYTIATPAGTFTGNRTSGSPIITSVSSLTNVQVGQAVSGTGIPAATYILSIDSGTQITLTQNASSGAATATTITNVAVTSTIVNVPTLRLTYKTINPIKIVLYRWSAAQQSYYQVTTLTTPLMNSTSVDYVSFTDSNADASIIGNSIPYTTGGVIENITAPAPSAMTLYKSRLFLVDAEDKNLLWFSKQVIEATPAEFSDLLTLYVAPTLGSQGSTGPMRCLAAMDDKLIIFKDNAIYYLVGTGPDNTGANNDFSDAIFITSTLGCTNQNSIVYIPDGLMFQSQGEIWLLGRNLQTSYIGAPVESFTESEVLSSVNVPGTNQVRFSLESGVTLMYDFFFNQWGTFYGIPAISSTLFSGMHTYINSLGQTFQESEGSYLDGSKPVLMSFSTSWLNFAGLQGYERAYWFNLIGEYISPHKLSVTIGYEYNSSPPQTTNITPDNFANYYGTDSPYGQSQFYGGSSNLEQWQVFFVKQKCQAFQVSIDEVFDSSLGTVAGAGLTLSGLNFMVGFKSSSYPINASRSR